MSTSVPLEGASTCLYTGVDENISLEELPPLAPECSIAEELARLPDEQLWGFFDRPYGENQGWMMEYATVTMGQTISRRLIAFNGKSIADGGVWREIRSQQSSHSVQIISPRLEGVELYNALRHEIVLFLNTDY